MKKFLLIILLMILPSMAYGGKFDDKLYLKLSIDNTKQYLPAIGIGYYFNDFYRIDLQAGKAVYFSSERYKLYDETVNDSSISGTKRISYKTQSTYFILSHYLNIADNAHFKVFINGGLGLGQIREKTTHLFSGMIINGDIITIPLSVDHYKSKKTQNFIYSLGTGTNLKINQKVNLELAYKYTNFGKPKCKKDDKDTIAIISSVKKYSVHSFSIGMRLDL